jgi:hypothetical protein
MKQAKLEAVKMKLEERAKTMLAETASPLANEADVEESISTM